MKTLNRQNFPGPQYPTRAIQFGEGNFLRAFIDWQLDLLNEQTDLATGVHCSPDQHRLSAVVKYSGRAVYHGDPRVE